MDAVNDNLLAIPLEMTHSRPFFNNSSYYWLLLQYDTAQISFADYWTVFSEHTV